MMAGMLSLFETVTQYSCNDTLLHTFLKTCTEHQTFLNKVSSYVHMTLLSTGTALSLRLFMGNVCCSILNINVFLHSEVYCQVDAVCFVVFRWYGYRSAIPFCRLPLSYDQ
jgi:hypothetical protein